jgi:7-keto-8-aminopelargonate synthetase-like enzyme
VAGYRARLAEALERAGHAPILGSVEGMLVYLVDRSAREVAAEIAARGGAVVKDLNAPEVSDRIRVSISPLHQDDEVDRLYELLASRRGPG